MPNCPDSIPVAFATDSFLRDAYRRGWNHGHGFACHNVPTIGESYFTESLGDVTVDAENVREVHQSFCFEAESNSRQYTPFEFIAHEFNSDIENSEALWEAFDSGIADSIFADLAEYTDSDYGIDIAA